MFQTDVIRKAFKKIFLSSDTEKMNFIRTKLTHLVADIPIREEPIPPFNLLSQQASDSSKVSDDSNKQSSYQGESMKQPSPSLSLSPSSTLPKKTSLASMFEDNDYEARQFTTSKTRTVHIPSLSNVIRALYSIYMLYLFINFICHLTHSFTHINTHTSRYVSICLKSIRFLSIT
jgi:hypothetical protein